MTDIANEAEMVGETHAAQKQLATNYVPDPNIGKPSSAWARLAQTGAAKTQKLNLLQRGIHDASQGVGGAASFVKGAAVQTAHAAKGAATGVARMLPGGMNDINAQTKESNTIDKSTQHIIQMQKAGQISKQAASKLLQANAGNASAVSGAQAKSLKSMPTTKEFAGDIAQTALLGFGGGGGKVVEEGGAVLLRQVGEQGVKDLAKQVGVDVAKKPVEDIAKEVASTSTGKAAIKTLTSGGTLARATKTAAKSAIGFGAFSAAGEAGAGGSNKQIAKAGAVGTVEGGVLGAAASLLKTGVRAATGRSAGDAELKATAAKHATATKMADEKGLPAGKSTETKTLTTGKSTPKQLTAGEKATSKSSTKVTVVDQPAETVKKEDVEATHKQVTTNLGEQLVKDIGVAKGKAQEDAISGKSDIGTAYKGHVEAAVKDYGVKLDKANTDHEAALKTVGTEIKPAVTHEEERGFSVNDTKGSNTAKVVNTRLSQLDNLISAAQKNGTTKSVTELRSLMRERSGLKDVASGKVSVEDLKGTPKDSVTLDKLRQAADKDAKVATLGGKRPLATTQSAIEDARAKGDTAEVQRLIKTIPDAPTRDSMRDSVGLPTSETKIHINPDTQKIERVPLNESGNVRPGEAVKDVKDLIEKHQATTQYSGDISRGGDMVEGVKKQIGSDTVKVAKSMAHLAPEDRKAILDYRDAKEAGLPTKELPSRLSKANDEITSLNKETARVNQERARLEGKPIPKESSPETYTHREAQGRGGILDQIRNGSKRAVGGGTSFGKRVGSDKGRTFQAITDMDGRNRRVVAVKNESFGKVKHLTGFDDNQKGVKLGKYKYDDKTNTLTDPKGKTVRLGEATTDEITKASGQKYYVHPQLTSLKNYAESRRALENLKYIESIKNHPDFEKFAAAPTENAPKNWETVHGLFQFMGYKFEPKTAEALRDIVKNSSDEASMADKVGNFLKQTIVYFPLKHNLNQTATYAVDRGFTSLVNPMAYKRGAVSLVKAFQEVTNEGPLFQKLQRAGFSMPSADEHALNNYVKQELRGLSKDDPRIIETAKSFGTSPARLYKAVTHQAVWQYGDILNTARVIERMQPKILSKGASFEDAMKQTEKYSLQYKVPSRIGPTKLGRSLSRTMQSPKVFFGRYRYDLYKIMGNTIKDTVNPKTLIHNPGQNIQAIDKLAAMAFGAATVWPLVDKGLQKLTGSKNANTSAPGALQIPELIDKIRSGKESLTTGVGNQVYPSPAVTIPLELQANRDSFTGKPIYDPNATDKQKASQAVSWLEGQSSFGQKAAETKGSSNRLLTAALGIAGVNFPKNSSSVSKLDSLQYDSLPSIQAKAKAQAKSGDFAGAQHTIYGQYDQLVLAAAKASYKERGQTPPPNNVLIKNLTKSGTYYAPKAKTIRGWQSKTPNNVSKALGL